MKRMLIGIACAAAGVALGWWIDAGRMHCADTTVIAVEGDTLWAIAERHCAGDVQKAVDKLVDKYGATIQPSQEIVLPQD
jgi:hypothetical protein